MNGAAFFLMTLLGLAVLYIIYLRIQLYINSKIVKAFQSSAVVIPQQQPKKGLSPTGFFVFLMVIFALVAGLGVAFG